MKSMPKRCLDCGTSTTGGSRCRICYQRRRGRRGPGASKQFLALRRSLEADLNATVRPAPSHRARSTRAVDHNEDEGESLVF
jgi:hypothetical protein